MLLMRKLWKRRCRKLIACFIGAALIAWVALCQVFVSNQALLNTPPLSAVYDQQRGVFLGLVEDGVANSTLSSLLDYGSSKEIGEPQSLLDVSSSNDVSRNNGIAVCLMYMDDDPYLVEWLAYHYHSLPLHRLIVAIDPKSTSSPVPILDRYRKRGLMNITVWHDKDFFFYMNRPTVRSLYRAKLRLEAKGNPIFAEYLTRQLVFYSSCMRMLHAENYTWIAIVDTDEYVVVNWSSDDKHRIQEVKPTLMEMLESPINRNLEALASPCIPMHRLTFGVKEEPNQTIAQNGLPEEAMCKSDRNSVIWNVSNFLTYRWRYPGDKRNDKVPGKCIVDLSRVNTTRNRDALSPWYMSPHRPIHDLCPPDVVFPKNHQSSFVVHHYMGTWEQWTYRNDTRSKRNKRETYQKHAYDFGPDDSARFWLQPFVEKQGCALAQALLSGAGKLEPR